VLSFRSFDRDGSGSLDAAEVASALKSIGIVGASSDVVAAVMEAAGCSASGGVGLNYDSFVSTLMAWDPITAAANAKAADSAANRALRAQVTYGTPIWNT